MKAPYCIKRIPNTERGNKAASILRAKGECHHRKRGRGARGSNWRWHQDLPMERATHFSLYGYPIGSYSGIWNGQYFGFIGWKNDKPVIRQLRGGKQ